MRSSGKGALLSMALALSACASSRTSLEADEPPALVMDENHVLMWNHPERFRPVPAAKREEGARMCASAGPGGHAIGYHPDARDMSGQAFSNGGFLCAQ